MMVAGIGCRKGVPPEAIEAALALTLERCGVARDQVDALATAAEKGGEPGIARLSEALALPLILVSESEMRLMADRALSFSARVMALKGVPSVAEAAALAAAGKGAQLLAPRISVQGATCAIAAGSDI